MSRCLLILVFACYLGYLSAQETSTEEEQVQPAAQTGITNLANELRISDSLLRAVGTAGVIITGIAGIAAILSFLLPMLGFKSCMLLGNCDGGFNEATGYNNVGSNSIYDQPGYSGYQYNGNPYKKRSLEYVGPILKMLTAAYDKYGPKPRQMKSVSVETQS